MEITQFLASKHRLLLILASVPGPSTYFDFFFLCCSKCLEKSDHYFQELDLFLFELYFKYYLWIEGFESVQINYVFLLGWPIISFLTSFLSTRKHTLL